MKRIAPGSIDPGRLHLETAYGKAMPKMKSPNHTRNLIREVDLIRNLKRENRQLKQLVANLTDDKAILEAIVRKRGWGES